MLRLQGPRQLGMTRPSVAYFLATFSATSGHRKSRSNRRAAHEADQSSAASSQGSRRGRRAYAATQAVSGFPTVWAQNTKDVTLVHMPAALYAAIKEIGDQASKDLGFKIVMQAITDDVQLNRSLTQPNTIDINNLDSPKLPYLAGKGVLASIPGQQIQAVARWPCRSSPRAAIPTVRWPRPRVSRRSRRCSTRRPTARSLRPSRPRVPDHDPDHLQRRQRWVSAPT